MNNQPLPTVSHEKDLASCTGGWGVEVSPAYYI